MLNVIEDGFSSSIYCRFYDDDTLLTTAEGFSSVLCYINGFTSTLLVGLSAVILIFNYTTFCILYIV